MYNRYQGNTGRVERREDFPSPAGPPPQARRRPPAAAPSELRGVLGSLLERIGPGRLETEDLMLGLLFYLLYRERGDIAILYLAGGVLLL
ncbi:MAG: hypothetical protein IKS66_04235 [Oscillospiraceae bacterium]|nr:hypothetical protein [Oscillospiraceae bacterium]